MHISLIFHKVVYRRIYSVVRSITITLSQIVCRVCQWKNFEKRSINGKDMDKSKVARFYGPPCATHSTTTTTITISTTTNTTTATTAFTTTVSKKTWRQWLLTDWSWYLLLLSCLVFSSLLLSSLHMTAGRGISSWATESFLCCGILIFLRNFVEFCRSWKFASD